ncbi:hypothetical protein EXIGLDRAFT_614112 [Exidia glandulosa HHB12029]|uniref:DNA2/NAM7 helicase-like C-terminal domain-containing protein n=1 Tax=Exidia glandulosa HHB12029 TaxID=1314781 RepID=A0A166AJX2_EXIGL|nr:hypothetical protein EXIGLDRAFT_614112 [Exidia glandulosa HHB12029]
MPQNIAEKLADLNFWDFKILVSYEFHFDWHEHIYEKIQQKVILSDEFPPTIVDVERALEGANVILCTLPMLSNYRVQASGFTTLVPVETLIVDEASQISLADYLVPASAFRHTLRKLVFVGDNQQHRLPPPLCRFISMHMYGGKLTAWNKHPVTTRNAACRFIHVPGGAETNVGTSWKNELEATACIAVARRLLSIGLKDFKVITPYDPQRDVIEKKLKAAGLPWKDTVFCVDSFQGNEAAHVIISVVRTSSPGFLKNVRRMNVMLSRCTRGMYICGSRTFLNGGVAQETLLGKMSREWGEGAWESVQDVLNRSKDGVA